MGQVLYIKLIKMIQIHISKTIKKNDHGFKKIKLNQI